MRIAWFAHSWLSDWNHGNAHFLRGLARALMHHGHAVRLYEPFPTAQGGWSLANLIQESRGAAAIAQFRAVYPELHVTFIAPAARPSQPSPHLAARILSPAEWEAQLADCDLVLVHEWVLPELMERLAALRRRHAFYLVFHDTHHRALSDPAALERLPLRQCDAVLVFGASLQRYYRQRLGPGRVYTMHEAADVSWFYPRPRQFRHDLVWIGNWGDEERTGALQRYLVEPARALQRESRRLGSDRTAAARVLVHGVRYPAAALARLSDAGVEYGGYLPNLAAPAAFAAAPLTLHVPRAPYNACGELDGIPTIRVFEALACGATLVCAPWIDSEGLFEAGSDYAMAADTAGMTALLRSLLANPRAARRLAEHGRDTVLARHTCAHRARELESICRDIGLTCSSSVPA